MNRVLPLFLVLMVSAVFIASADAQKKSAPEVNIALKSSDELLNDLKFILSLTEEKSQKQWKVIKDYLDFFLTDINKNKPIRIDVISEGDATYFRSAFPVSDLPAHCVRLLKTLPRLAEAPFRFEDPAQGVRGGGLPLPVSDLAAHCERSLYTLSHSP